MELSTETAPHVVAQVTTDEAKTESPGKTTHSVTFKAAMDEPLEKTIHAVSPQATMASETHVAPLAASISQAAGGECASAASL